MGRRSRPYLPPSGGGAAQWQLACLRSDPPGGLLQPEAGGARGGDGGVGDGEGGWRRRRGERPAEIGPGHVGSGPSREVKEVPPSQPVYRPLLLRLLLYLRLHLPPRRHPRLHPPPQGEGVPHRPAVVRRLHGRQVLLPSLCPGPMEAQHPHVPRTAPRPIPSPPPPPEGGWSHQRTRRRRRREPRGRWRGGQRGAWGGGRRRRRSRRLRPSRRGGGQTAAAPLRTRERRASRMSQGREGPSPSPPEMAGGGIRRTAGPRCLCPGDLAEGQPDCASAFRFRNAFGFSFGFRTAPPPLAGPPPGAGARAREREKVSGGMAADLCLPRRGGGRRWLASFASLGRVVLWRCG